MSRRLRKAKESLRKTRNFAMGLLIGSAMVTPVFAASDIAIDDMTTPVLVGSLVLLVIGLALKATRDKPADKTAARPPQPVAQTGFSEGIGQYRLQLGRGDAY